MANQNVRVAMAAMMGLWLQGCATAMDKKVDLEVSQEAPVKQSVEIQQKADALIRSTPGFNESQRAGLQLLRNDVSGRMNDLSEQNLKLRALLVKDLLSTEYNPEEIAAIQGRLHDVAGSQADVLSTLVDRTNSILGRNQVQSGPAFADWGGGRSGD